MFVWIITPLRDLFQLVSESRNLGSCRTWCSCLTAYYQCITYILTWVQLHGTFSHIATVAAVALPLLNTSEVEGRYQFILPVPPPLGPTHWTGMISQWQVGVGVCIEEANKGGEGSQRWRLCTVLLLSHFSFSAYSKVTFRKVCSSKQHLGALGNRILFF